MKKSPLLYEKLLSLFWKIGGCLFLMGQETIRGRQKIDPAGFDPEMFKFSGPKLPEAPGSEYIQYWMIAGVVVGIFVFVLYLKYSDILRLRAMGLQESAFQLATRLYQLHLLPYERDMFMKIAGTSDPRKLLPILDSVKKFEKKVELYKTKYRDPKTLKTIVQLRRKLEFDFENDEVPFLNTRMLLPHMTLECALPRKKSPIFFKSTILAVAEDFIALRVPKVRGKSANLRSFPYVTCQIRRGDEADYRFKLPIIKQTTGKFEALVVNHTNKIKKLFIRKEKRVPLHLPTTFYVLPEEVLFQRAGSYRDLRGQMALPSFPGEIVDMSTGGIKIVGDQLPETLESNDMLLFPLQGAGLRDDLLLRVVKQTMGTPSEIHAQFFQVRQLTQLKLKKYVHNLTKATIPHPKKLPSNTPLEKNAYAEASPKFADSGSV